VDLKVAYYRQDAEGDFFRRIAESGKFTMASGRLHGLTAAGKLLCSDAGSDHYWRDCSAAGAWDKWVRLPAEERKPGAVKVNERKADPKVPAPPPGALVLKAYQRMLEEDGAAGVRRRKVFHEAFGGGGVPYEPGHDYVWFGEAEWNSLIPAALKKGDQFQFPALLADRLVRDILTDCSANQPVGWEPADVRSLQLGLKVEEVTPAGLRLRLEGSVLLAQPARAPVPKAIHGRWLRDLPCVNSDPSAAPRYEARLLGHLRYEVKKKAFTRFDVVALGSYTGIAVNPFRGEGREQPYHLVLKPFPLGVALQIARGGQVVPPGGCSYRP